MGNRLSRIVTRTGDLGTTGLADGSRVSKRDPRVVAMGDVDELNCCLGQLLAQPLPAQVSELLIGIQHDLFDLGGELSIPAAVIMDESYVSRLERLVEEFNHDLPPLKEFVLPGGGGAATVCHLARAVCRRAERSLWVLYEDQAVNAVSCVYLNRLSDLLFIIARVLGRASGGEVTWDRNRRRD
ncbi:MAG: cob(I)yrinic acid a,c-diamide adenosyltransferase [Chromatiales bacterium]